MRKLASCFAFTVSLWLPAVVSAAAPQRRAVPPSPDAVYGQLFVDVQRSRIFSEQKDFADAVPRMAPAKILADYQKAKAAEGAHLDLRAFVATHFLLPETQAVKVPAGQSLDDHIASLWTVLQRAPDRAVPGSSLLPLPHPYIIPGGRFREVYYWDSYFTMLGLRESGREDLIEAMVDNFAYLIHTYGFIPNGNRTYYLSRSQPPFFALMVGLLAEKHGDAIYTKYLPALRAEYAYWNDQTAPTRHTVTMPDGSKLSRYYDQKDTPRPESFAIDETLSQQSAEPAPELYRNLRAAAESGWDFSTRWFADGKTLATIHTTDIVPVDLNCLLANLEHTLAKAYQIAGDTAQAERFASLAAARRKAILTYCWSAERHYFFDYDLSRHGLSESYTLAGVVPLFLKLATPEQGTEAAATVREKFLHPGGVVTTFVHSGQQWDAPNGWAPLEWMTIRGVDQYGAHDLAADIAHRWLALNARVYAATGKMMEKYDVEDVSRPAGGGEYPAQDGFGWSNGVYLALEHAYPVSESKPPATP